MPSGAKKRKAAKKKKEKEAYINPSPNNPEGTDDSKSQDERGSDGGSPAFQDHRNHPQPFTEGSEELGERDPSSVRVIVPEDKATEEVSGGVDNSQEVGLQDGVVAIERDLKHEDDSESKNITVEHIESAKKSYDGDHRRSSSSSSSSSDDDSRTVEKKPNKEATHSVSVATSYDDLVKPIDPEDVPAGKTSDSIAQMSPVVDSVKPVAPVSEETLNVLESAPIENKGAEKLCTGAPIFEFSAKKVENKVLLDENGDASSSVLESESKRNEDEILPSSGGPVAQTSNGAESIKEPEIPEYSENQPLVAPAPRVVQKTPWWNCCGIFDVITGSSR
ncbi:hypothetical protein FEM48_Zijuj01G0057300 [Ziziphus jujuba var. spinosa]|uniref:Uncharacterized protein n=1 Tax=Ziziphus jujuba var. spinosa TaxID=714518 RepID=A0A978VZG5_ZIZJJ|nr:hypothetical protein FEM48_Zijuj01G0057300 [Ziziphus jujuba var. spinosa]